MLQFMYQGEVSIKQEDIASFLKVAEILKIKGLTRNHDDDLQDDTEKDLVDALPLIHPERTNNNVTSRSPTAYNAEPFCDMQVSWNASSPCRCTPNTPKEEKSYREPNEPLMTDSNVNPTDHHRPPDVDDDQPLDCSASVCEDTSKSTIEFPEYKPDLGLINPEIRHLTPEVECIQRTTAPPPITTIPQPEQENMDTMLNPQLMPYAAPQCQSEPVGFHEATVEGTCTANDYSSQDPSSSSSSTAPAGNKGRRTIKGLPGSSLSLETTLRFISELVPITRMERGKVIHMYTCPWCLRHFTRRENLKLHVKYIHGPLESLTCKLCGNKYKNSNSLRVHSYLYHNAQRNKSSGGGKSPVVGGNV
ncbi:uncharacterized protein LOC131663958 isoform X2 [Phymastichus coffea]|nr:uncharacterized protein LOC131663958 isoform X2 [Phymastichus coffea]